MLALVSPDALVVGGQMAPSTTAWSTIESTSRGTGVRVLCVCTSCALLLERISFAEHPR
jgi:hypothetical protein